MRRSRQIASLKASRDREALAADRMSRLAQTAEERLRVAQQEAFDARRKLAEARGCLIVIADRVDRDADSPAALTAFVRAVAASGLAGDTAEHARRLGDWKVTTRLPGRGPGAATCPRCGWTGPEKWAASHDAGCPFRPGKPPEPA